MLSFKLLTPPAVEPVLLAEAKLHARIDTAADDTLVASLLVAARQWVERHTGRALITQTWQGAMDGARVADGVCGSAGSLGVLGREGGSLILPRAPLQSVLSVQAFDETDTGVLWPSSQYFVDTLREPGRLTLRQGAVWPVAMRRANGMVVTYVVGYGDDGTAVPEPIKTAIRALVAHWYEHRGEAVTASSGRAGATLVPLTIEALLGPYRVVSVGG